MTEPKRSPQGPKVNKWWIIGGGVAAVAVYFYYRKSSSAANTAGTSGLTPAYGGYYYDSNGNLVDSNGNPVMTGYGPSGVTPSLYGYYDQATGQYITGYGAATTSPTAPPTESAWYQQVVAYMQQNNPNFDFASFSSGVANWLYGPNRLSPAEYTAVEQGLAAYGTPPGVTTTPAREQQTQPAPSTTNVNIFNAVRSVYENYLRHGPRYAKQAAGAAAAIGVMKSTVSVAANRAAVQRVIDNYRAHGPTYAGQVEGASAVLAKIH